MKFSKENKNNEFIKPILQTQKNALIAQGLASYSYDIRTKGVEFIE